MAHLTLLLDNREVRKFVLNRGVTTIGRAQDNDIVINNLALSRRHAQVEYKSGRFEVVDLQSQNGVYVNQERVRGPRPLDDRDSITLGTYQFVFRASEDSEPAVKKVRPSRPRPETTEPGAKDDDASESPESVPLLVLKYNDVELQRFPITVESCLVGRAKECDVQIPERRLSRKHCEIRRIGARYQVNDLGSQNGTYVNRRRIKGTHDLAHGDVLNFAEYSVLFLAEAGQYQGPDAEPVSGRPSKAPPGQPTQSPGFEKEPTSVPRAYRDDDNRPPVRPSDVSDPDDESAPAPPMQMSPKPVRRTPVIVEDEEPPREPLIKSPTEARSKRINKIVRPEVPTQPPPPGRRSEQRSELPSPPTSAPPPPLPSPRRSLPPAEPEPAPVPLVTRSRPSVPPKDAATGPVMGRAGAVRVEALQKKKASVPPPRVEESDVSDPGMPDRDEALDDWYQKRHERSEMFERPVPEEEDDLGSSDEPDSLLPPRGQSSVSQVLSQMMVGKNEIDTNMKQPKARKRRFNVDVRHHQKLLYSGPLNESVTILGTDREADIQLKGRYVAGRHSLLVRVRDSLLLVRLGSSSAARVNGLPKLQAFLKTGDVIQIDETTITVTEE